MSISSILKQTWEGEVWDVLRISENSEEILNRPEYAKQSSVQIMVQRASITALEKMCYSQDT